MANYVENMYRLLQRKGYSATYEHAGIYKISIDGIVAYIGKSDNMLRRLAENYVSMQKPDSHKYEIFAEAKRNGLVVRFEVLYYATSKWYSAIKEEIGEAEGKYIRSLRPPLNYQIPKESNWKKYDVNPTARTITLPQILNL